MEQIKYACTLPVKYDVDVFVAGGGPTGMAAGVTAARQGARVFLAEGQGCFGGMGTAAGLPMFCEPTDGVHVTTAGFGTEVYERLRRWLVDEGQAEGQPDPSVAPQGR